jgi:hypothetical protein
MDPDRAKRLSALIWQERIKTAALIIVIVVVVASILFAGLFHNAPSESERLDGEVTGWSRYQTETGAGAYVITVTLAGGHKVTATASRYGRAPRMGEQIKVNKITTLTGHIRYEWRR